MNSLLDKETKKKDEEVKDEEGRIKRKKYKACLKKQ